MGSIRFAERPVRFAERPVRKGLSVADLEL